jgi:predicted amidophosphoribosyltransferase
MRPPIQDEFTHLPISRQQKYQLRRHRDKLCRQCGRPIEIAWHCRACADKLNAHQRRYAKTRLTPPKMEVMVLP